MAFGRWLRWSRWAGRFKSDLIDPNQLAIVAINPELNPVASFDGDTFYSERAEATIVATGTIAITVENDAALLVTIDENSDDRLAVALVLSVDRDVVVAGGRFEISDD